MTIQQTPSRQHTPDAAIVAAAREEFVQYGMRRANVEQIAQRAGVSRVTVYRRFSNKAGLLRAVIQDDIAEFMGRFDAVWYGAETAEEKIVESVALCLSEIRSHPLLHTLRRSEPEQLLLQLTTDGEATFELFRTVLVARFEELVQQGALPPHDVARSCEVMLRLGYSVALQPYGTVPGESEEQVRAFAREVIVPLFEPQAA